MPGTTEIVLGDGGGFIEILYAAGDFTPHRSVHDAIKWLLGISATTSISASRARVAGSSIDADTRIRLRCIGRYAYPWEAAGSEPKRYPRDRFMKP